MPPLFESGRMSTPLKPSDLPSYWQLVLPVIRCVADAGGSATVSEIDNGVVTLTQPSDEMLAVAYENRPASSVFLDGVAWARSWAKLIGAVENPSRGVYVITALGREILAMAEPAAVDRIRELDREYRRRRHTEAGAKTGDTATVELGSPSAVEPETPASEENGPVTWQETLWARLHTLSPEAFEELVLYVLRLYGMELTRIGGSGDEGIDGIGTARLTEVLSTRVAVQVKRYDPKGRPVGREVVALLQRDAAYRGAERAILVTLGRFTEQARKAAIATTPTVELIDGTRLADLMLEQEVGVHQLPKVDERWFDRFEE